jgi:hypothetical protein
MTRSESRVLACGVAVMAMALLLWELLVFRISAATIGHGFAMFAALLLPAAVGLGALGMALVRLPPDIRPVELARAASYCAAAAGGLTALGAIAASWASQQVASNAQTDADFIVAVALVAWLLPGVVVGASMGCIVRLALPTIGRIGAFEAGGAVAACLAAPLVLEAGGARTILGASLLLAAAALLLARAAREASPRWSALWTLPLALTALLAGDLGEPWLAFRTDAGRKSGIDHATWTAQGHLAIEKADRGPKLYIDRHPPVSLPAKLKGGAKKPVEPEDLAYVLWSGSVGPVLVVGTAGGREIQVALWRDAERVDVVEPHAGVLERLHHADYEDATVSQLTDPQRVRVVVGDGRAALRGLGSDYQLVVVVESGRFDQTAPRLLSRDDRRYTTAAIVDYLGRLRGDGALSLSVRPEGMPAAMAAASAALGKTPADAAKNVVACSDDKRGVLVVSPQSISAAHQSKMIKRCKKLKMKVDHPVQRAPGDAPEADGFVHAAAMAAPPSEERPFLVPPDAVPPLVSAVRDLAPSPAHAGKRKKAPPPGEVEPYVEPSREGLAGAAALAGGVVLALAAIALVRLRRRDPSGPLGIQIGLPFSGLALAVCSFALADLTLRVLGNRAYGWALVIPLGLVGVAAGRLYADVPPRERLPRVARVAMVASLVGLVAAGVGWDLIAGLGSASLGVRLAAVLVLLVAAGWALGFPLAAGLRLAGRDAIASWGWGAHLAGWALGGALAALLVPYVGVQRLWPIGLGAFAVAALAFTSRRRRSPSQPAAQPEQA